jgi:hypothetical protein
VTLILLLGAGVRLGTVAQRLKEQARRREKRYASDEEKTSPAPSSVARWSQ